MAELSESQDLEKAEFLARSTSKSTVVFRRYDKLALRNLLHLNEKLYRMEKAFWSKTQGSQDQASVGGARIEGPPDATRSTQKQNDDRPNLDMLAVTIKDYYEALHLYSQILKLGAPPSRTTKFIHKWLRKKRAPESYGMQPEDNERDYTDLMCLYTPPDNDFLSQLATSIPYIKLLFIDMHHSEIDEYYFNENHVQKSVTFIGLVLAVLFLVGAMWALWRETDNVVAQLAIVTGFVVAFAVWVGFFTSMSRREVIVATAAYAAVLVVFVNSS